MFSANIEKYSQNPGLLQDLLATGDRELVESNPHDTIWGSGRSIKNKLAAIRTSWRGQNLMGSTLQRVRHALSHPTHQNPLNRGDDIQEMDVVQQ